MSRTVRRHRPRWFLQFSLRTALIVMTLTAICSGIYVGFVAPYKRQHEAGLALAEKGVTIEWRAADPIMLEPGDTVLLVTDGICEARSPAKDFFGAERTLEIVRANRDRNAREIVEGLFAAIREFSRRSTPVDDTTAVVIKVTQ